MKDEGIKGTNGDIISRDTGMSKKPHIPYKSLAPNVGQHYL